MPTRIIREGIISSPRVNSLTERAELFYRKLMSVVDDYGRFYSNPISILGACYPMRESVTVDDVKQMLSECEAVDLLLLYGDRKFILLRDFNQQTRSKSKFPEPTENELLIKCKSIDKQMSSLGGVGDVVECVGESASGAHFPEANLPTWEDVLKHAEMTAVPESSARSFFRHHEDNNLWVNQHGRMINWKTKITAWSVNDRNKKTTNGAKQHRLRDMIPTAEQLKEMNGE